MMWVPAPGRFSSSVSMWGASTICLVFERGTAVSLLPCLEMIFDARLLSPTTTQAFPSVRYYCTCNLPSE